MSSNRYKRHEAHRAEWIRHQDDVAKMTNSSSSSCCTSAPQRFPLVLILDNLRSANNVGSLFRTADAAGCRMVIAIGITAHPNGHSAEKLQKTAMGAQWTVPCTHFASLKTALEYVRTEFPQYQILGVETTAKSVDYREFAYASAPDDDAAGVALVLGNEVTGVDATILPTLDGIVEIPMFGAKNSLNVAVCAPIILYEIHRQWKSSSSSSSTIATTKELTQETP
jgi:23S rRNA (guanosine2251-2'-O)-methyltransferase